MYPRLRKGKFHQLQQTLLFTTHFSQAQQDITLQSLSPSASPRLHLPLQQRPSAGPRSIMATLAHLLARADENRGCTQNTCPVSESVYGYRPSLGATIFFLILFALSGCLYAWQGLKTKTYFFTWAMILGSLSEILGYVAKLLLWNDPFSDTGFKMSVVLLTFAPAFYAAGIYYTLRHICLTFGPDFSRLKPAWYTYIFISCDLFSIVLQAVGGALASVADDDALLNAGDNVMVTGLVTQVFTLVVFGAFAADYAYAAYRHRHELNPATVELRRSLRFKLFIVALWVAFSCILIRCAYRVAELVNGEYILQWLSLSTRARVDEIQAGCTILSCMTKGSSLVWIAWLSA